MTAMTGREIRRAHRRAMLECGGLQMRQDGTREVWRKGKDGEPYVAKEPRIRARVVPEHWVALKAWVRSHVGVNFASWLGRKRSAAA